MAANAWQHYRRGLGYPYGIYETVLKESMEEANLEKSVIEDNIKATGSVSYLYFTGDISVTKFNKESDFIVGEVQYVYDLKLSEDIIPNQTMVKSRVSIYSACKRRLML